MGWEERWGSIGDVYGGKVFAGRLVGFAETGPHLSLCVLLYTGAIKEAIIQEVGLGTDRVGKEVIVDLARVARIQ